MSQIEVDRGVAAQDSPAMGVPLWRLYTLRLSYVILSVGLGLYIWPDVLQHTAQFAGRWGIQASLLAGIGATALLGLRYPVKMIPLLLFELTWKAVFLTAFALPLWRAHQITSAERADISSVLTVVIFLPLIPWSHVWRQFVTDRGDRWR